MPEYTARFVIFNGPPSSGKSTFAPELARQLRVHLAPDQVCMDSFAAPMKHYIATAMAWQYQEMKKERPEAVLQGYSIREFLIDLSERYMKPRYGDDVFARLLLYRILRRNPQPRFVVVDDCGFDEEITALTRPFLVRITRPGTSFKGDSRNFVSQEPDWLIENDGTIEECQKKIAQLASHLVQNVK